MVAGWAVGMLVATAAHANPAGPSVVHGGAAFSGLGTPNLTVTNRPGAIINWQGFSIARHELTRFIQDNADSAVLNRVVGQDPSHILGRLQSNGRVFLVNPHGIVFGPDALIDTAGLVAATLEISDEDFLAGNLKFSGDDPGAIDNQGVIRAGGGDVYLIAPQIHNSGVITTAGGDIVLAAGRAVTITDITAGEVYFEVQAPADEVVNLGALLADGGAVKAFAGTLRHGGKIRADSLRVDETGTVVLRAAGDMELAAGSTTSASGAAGGDIRVESAEGDTVVRGRVTATGAEARGGSIHVLGERVGLFGDATVDASGTGGGGEVVVGGDYQGANPAVRNAVHSVVAGTAGLRADATDRGDGGKVIVWSDGRTDFQGEASARGGVYGGNGGLIEVSGKGNLAYTGDVDARAPAGRAGTILFDPKNIIITTAGVAIPGNLVDFPTGGDGATSSFTPASIVAALNGGNVELRAHNDITVTDAINTAFTGVLRLEAGRNVSIDNDIITAGGFFAFANSGGGDPAFRDGGAGGVTVAAGATVQTGAGQVLLLSSSDVNGANAGITLGDNATVLTTGAADYNVLAGTGGALTIGNGVTLSTGAGLDMFIEADTLSVGTTFTLNTNGGNLWLDTSSTGVTMGISGGAGAMQVPANFMNALNMGGGTLHLGSNGTGDIAVGAAGFPINNMALDMRSGGSIAIAGPIDGAGTIGTPTIRIDGDSNTAEDLDLSGAAGDPLPNAVFILTAGGDGDDRILGPGIANVWSLDGAGDGTLNGDSITGFQNFWGSAGGGTNTFTFTAGTVPAGSQFNGNSTPSGHTVDLGAAGADITFTQTASNAMDITVGGATINVANVGNYTGGAGNDTFVFDANNLAQFTGTLDGGGGTDALDFALKSSGVTVDLNALTATFTGGFANIEDFTGSSVADTLRGANGANAWSIDGADSGTVGGASFDSFENLTGGTLADQFAFTATGALSGAIDGGAGADGVDLSGGDATFAGFIPVLGTNLSNVEDIIGSANTNDTLIGDGTGQTWAITGGDADGVIGTVDGISFSGFSRPIGGAGDDGFSLEGNFPNGLSLDAGGGADTITLTNDVTSPLGMTLRAETIDNTGDHQIVVTALQFFTAAGAVGSAAHPVLTDIDVLNLNSITGSDLYISETDGLAVNLNTVTPPNLFQVTAGSIVLATDFAGGTVDLTTTAGDIDTTGVTLTTSTRLSLDAQGDVLLGAVTTDPGSQPGQVIATGLISLSDIVSLGGETAFLATGGTSDITVNAGGRITAADSNFLLDAGRDVNYTGTLGLNNSSNGTITVTAGRDVNFTGGGINTSGGAIVVMAGNDLNYDASSNINSSSGSVNVDAGRDFNWVQSRINTSSGPIGVFAGRDINVDTTDTFNSSSGAITFDAGDNASFADGGINTSGGDVSVTAVNSLSFFGATDTINTSSGDISIDALDVFFSDTRINTSSGAITVDAGNDFTYDGSGSLNSSSGSISLTAINAMVIAEDISSSGPVFLDAGGPVTVGPGTIDFEGRPFTLASGAVDVPAGVTLRFRDRFDWNGGTLAGGGAVDFGPFGTLELRVGGGVARTLSGLTIVSDGILLASGALELAGGTWTADGVSTIGAGAELRIAGGLFDATGALDVDGILAMGGGNLNAAPLTVNAGGMLTGDTGLGIVGGDVVNHGTVAPGASAGTLAILGDYTQGPGGILEMELGGILQGVDHDWLDIGGSAFLDGTLDVAALGGFTGSDGDTFEIISYGAVSGDFATVNLPVAMASLTVVPGPTAYGLEVPAMVVEPPPATEPPPASEPPPAADEEPPIDTTDEIVSLEDTVQTVLSEDTGGDAEGGTDETDGGESWALGDDEEEAEDDGQAGQEGKSKQTMKRKSKVKECS